MITDEELARLVWAMGLDSAGFVQIQDAEGRSHGGVHADHMIATLKTAAAHVRGDTEKKRLARIRGIIDELRDVLQSRDAKLSELGAGIISRLEEWLAKGAPPADAAEREREA